jgi:hypothetical protein
MKIFRCAAPLFFRWFEAINMGGALHLCDLSGKYGKKENQKRTCDPFGVEHHGGFGFFYKHAIPSGLVS